jgi:Bacterial Ig-like domain (group 3)/Beta-propeller repeat/Dockerin type I domain
MALSWVRNLFEIKSTGPRKTRRHWHRLSAELLEDRTLLSATSGLQQAYGQLPLSFEVNNGQTASQVQYLSHGSGYALFLTENSAVLSLTQPSASAAGQTPTSTGVALAMNLVGANPQAKASGLDEQSGKSNYFIGNDPSQWHANIANYGKVEYQGVYPGINLVYYGNQQQLEYDFVVAPGANPNRIQLNFQGANSISLDAKGDLVLHTASGDVLQQAPVIYQIVHGARHTVSGRFVLGAQGRVSFQVGAYNASLPLTIDPVLSYSTYLGGNSSDRSTGIAVDGAGNAYLTGYTSSTNFPTTTGAFQTSFGGINDAFVTELNASGTALVYSTYLGGNSDDEAFAIALDGSGNAYVTGETNSPNFPTTSGAFQTSPGGNYDAFVTEVNAGGASLGYSTYLGGQSKDYGTGIAVDSSGNAYVTGATLSSNFSTTSGAFQPNWSGSEKIFVTKLSATGTSLVYSTYLGGSAGQQAGQAIAVDNSGNAYVTGYTYATDFPTTAGAIQTSHAADDGLDDAFVTKFNADGSALVYSTFLGGNGQDSGQAIALDGSGNAYVAVDTTSTDLPTTTGAFQPSHASDGGTVDGFVAKLNTTGTALVYGTYLGGTGMDVINGIQVDAASNAYLVGQTTSPDFPITADAFQSSYAGGSATDPFDAFVTKLDAAGAALLYSTYFGGTGGDHAVAIALDASDNVYFSGRTSSTDFPTTAGAFQTSAGGGSYTGFVAKFSFGSQTTTTLINNGPNPSPYGESVSFTVTVSGGSSTDGETVTIEDADNADAIVASPTLSGGTVTFDISNLSAGSHELFAIYHGNATNAASDSSLTLVSQVVIGGAPTISSVVLNQDISALYNAAGQPFAGAQRSMVNDIVYTFSEPVSILDSGVDPNVFTISVASGWTGTVPTLSWAAVAGSGGTEWAISFSGDGVTGNSIANGAYTITVTDPGSITAESDGEALSLGADGTIGGATQSFYRLFGDINGDHFVNASDNAKFKQALTTYNAAFDFSQDGFVNASDNAKFKNDLTVNFSGFTATI